jgi:putative ABC transport system substrate-binding protein
MEFAREVMPGASKIGLLTNLSDPKATPQAQELLAAGRGLEIEITSSDANRPEEIESALEVLASRHVDIVIVLQSSMLLGYSGQIAALALAKRLPTVYGYRAHVIAGGLASYGVDLEWCWRRAATFVDKILHGARPGDLPVEFPTKMLLAINLKTAKALGLTVPSSLLVRADEVIE